jgi:RNA polymerase sigma-70 factor (ECF subfamily)
MAPAADPDAEDRLFAKQIVERLERALHRLTIRQRAVFSLRHYEDRSLAEIAGILDLDVGTVKVHLFRAVEKLREELHDLYFREGRNETLDRT